MEIKENIPEHYDLSGDISGYLAMRNQKREDYRRAVEANIKTPKVRADQFEVYLNALLRYAEDMPDSPLQITEYQAGWLVTKMKVYKKWGLSKEKWGWTHAAKECPELRLHFRPLIVEYEEEAEQTEMF